MYQLLQLSQKSQFHTAGKAWQNKLRPVELFCVTYNGNKENIWWILQVHTPLELHLTTSELWFGQEQEGILP